jgi:hypothetical protein
VGEGKDIIAEKYPAIASLLDCMWFKESHRGADKRRGDGGLAYGHFQIHIDKHPVSEACALDFECSLDYTAQMVMAGKGYLWSSYYPCGGA